MKARLLTIFLLLLGNFNIPSVRAVDDAEMTAFKHAIRQKYDLKERAYAQNNVALNADGFYSPNAIEVGDGDPVVIGREAIRVASQQHIHDKIRIESISTHVEGSTGWDWTNFYVVPADPKATPLNLVILFLWKRLDSEWWCVGESYSRGEFKGRPPVS